MLYRSAGYFFGMNLFASITGFLFWALAARFYSSAQLGYAITLVAMMGLLSTLSALGLGFGLMRHLPKVNDAKKSGELITSALVLTGLSGFMATFLVLIFKNQLVPSIAFLLASSASALLFGSLVAASNVSWVLDSIFMGQRVARYAFLKNSFAGILKVLLVVPLISLGTMGLFSSYAFPILVSSIFGLIYLLPRSTGQSPEIKLSRQAISEILPFSLANYLADIFSVLPNFLFPIIVINTLSPEATAHFYIAWIIASVFYTLPMSIGISLLVEATKYDEELGDYVSKSIKAILAIIIPVIFLVWMFGGEFLLLLGEEYSVNSEDLLLVLIITAIPYGLNRVHTSVFNVKNEIKKVALLNALVSTGSIVSAYFVVPSFGILGVGYAWLAIQTIVAFAVLVGYLFVES
jgi:O-antigen/teichoic acid export membrane protein